MNKSVFSDDFDSLIGYTPPQQRQQPQQTRTSYAPAGLTQSAPVGAVGSGSGMGGGSVFSDDFDALIGYGSSQPAQGGYQPPSYTPPSYSGGWDPYTLEDEQAKLEEEERKRRNPYGVVRNKLGQVVQGAADVIGQGLKGMEVLGASAYNSGAYSVPNIGGMAMMPLKPETARTLRENPLIPGEGPAWAAGEGIQKKVAEAVPVNEDATFWDEVARGAGSTVGFGMGGLLTGGNPLGVAMSGAMVGMGSGYEEAKQHGADDTEAQLAGALSGLVGVSEVAPVGKWVGKLTRVIPQGKILNRIKEAGIEGLDEMLQETFQSTAGNAIAREIYDEDRELFEGVARSGVVGGVSGLLMGAVVNALPGRQRGAAPQRQKNADAKIQPDPLAPQATEQTQQQQTLDALNAQLRAGQAPLPQGTEIIQGAPQEVRPPKAAANAAPGVDIFSSLIPSDEIAKLERFKREQQKNKEAVQARQAETKLAVVGVPQETLKTMTDERKVQLAQSSPEEIRAAQQKLEERKAETTRIIQEEMAKQREAEARAKPAWMKSRDEYAVHSGVYEADEAAQADAERRQWQEIEAAAWRGDVAPSEVVDPAWRRKVQQIETERSLREKEDKWQQWEQLQEAEQDALVYEYEREMLEESGELDTPDYASPDELQNRISRTGKLMHPDNLRDANDPLAGEVRAIYEGLNIGQRRKLFAGKNERGLTLDAMRESLSEGGSGFDFSTPDDLLQAMDESIMRGRPQMAHYAASPDEVRFSAADPAAQDSEYMAAVERGDTETAQRMVDERAKAAGYYGQRKFYHGTPDGRFNTFERGRGIFSDSRNSFVFTDSKEVADEFRGGVWATQNGEVIKQYPNTSAIKTVYLDLKNVDQWDYFGGSYKEGAVLQAIKEAKKAGKKGVIFRNMRDGSVTTTGRWPMSNVVFVFEPEQIKSAEPITRDDEGKVIPLSRRFDSTSPDIRYSAADPAAQDAEYMSAVERGDTETAQRMVDEAAKAAGYEVQPLYHGGPDGFFKFDWSRMGEQGTSEGKGFYFTNDKDVAEGYSSRHGGRLLEVYLKSGTRLDGKKNTIPAAKWKSILLDIHKTAEEQDGEGSSPLWNFDDVGSYGANRVATKVAQDLVRYSESDVDLIADLIHSGANPKMVYDAVEAHTGKTGILEKDAWDKAGHDIHVATSQNAVKLTDPITRDDEGKVIPLSRRFDNTSPDIRYSAGEGARQQAARQADPIDHAVADLTSKWKRGRVEVKDLRDLPAGDLREIRERGMLRSAGYFNTRTGRITLIRNNLRDPAHAVRVALHEAVGHYGVRAVLGDQFGATMQMVADAYRGKELWRKTLARWKLDPATRPGDAIIAAEEIVAQMAEGKIDNPNLWTRITAAIRRALGMISSQEWTDIQIRRLLTQSRRYLEGRRKAARSTRPAGSTTQATRQSAEDQDILALQHIDLKALTDDKLFEKGEVVFEQWEQAKGTEKARLKRLYNKIEQEQRDRRVAAFINKPPPPVEFAQLDADYMAAVEKGDTAQMIQILDKVAKEKGYTIKGYHGTPDGRFIDQSHRFGGRYASIAPGYQEVFWFAKSSATAASYADDRRATDYQNAEPRTWQGYLKITNPLEVFAHGRAWRDAQLRGKTGYVIDEAREKGNDGIIIYDVKDNYNNTAKTKTTDTYSVFTPEQIKSADPITRDDSGRIIPPSERFKDSSPDIRFSAPEPVGFHMYPMEVDVGKFTDAQLQERLEMLTNLIEERQADNQPINALMGLRSEVRAEIADRKLAAEQEGAGESEVLPEPEKRDAPPVKPNPKQLRRLEAEILEARKANKTVAESVILERNQLAAAQTMSDITQAGTMKRQAVEQLRKDQAGRIMEGVVEEAMSEEERAHMATVKNLMLRGATYQEKPRWERIKEWFKGILDGWDQYAGIKNDDPRFTKFRDQANDLRGAKERIAQEAQEIVKRIVGPIDKLGRNVINKDVIEHYRREVRRVKAKGVKAIKQADLDKLQELEAEMLKSPYALFQNLLLYKDLATRAEMISPLTGKPVVLPQGLKKAEVVAELNRLIGILDGHEYKQQIIDAMRAHYQAMANEKELLEKYGYLIPAEQQNPYYYPHLVIDYMSGKFKNAKVIEDKPFRGYMEELTGSKLDIETDYISAVFSHLYAVRIHNAQADFVKNGIESYDITEEIRKELQEQENEEASRKNRKAAKISASEAQKPYNVPEGYVLHTIDERLPFRPVEVIDREKLGKALGVAITQDVDLKKFLKDTGADVKLTAEMIEGAMAIGKRRKVIIPVEMHNAVRDLIAKEVKVDGWVVKTLSWTISAWKKQKLYRPTNWPRYEFGNLSTDIIDRILAGDPGVLKYMPRAWKEVRQFWRDGSPPSPELQQAYKNRVLDSVTAQEMGELSDSTLRQFDNFATTAGTRWRKAGDIVKSIPALGLPQLTSGGVARNSVEASAIREGIFRYAKYLAALDRMQHGADPIYQGAAKVDVEATTDSAPDAQDAIYRKAAKIARRTFVDYGEMSANGEALRKSWMPFWSWVEGNWKGHRNLLHNLNDLRKAGEITVLHQHAVATVNASRIAAGVVLRMLMPYFVFAVWNNAIAPMVLGGPDDDDLEKYLSAADRRKMHIITGFDPVTKRIRVMYVPTALGEVAEWFAGMELAGGIVDAATGRIPPAQAAQEWVMHFGKDWLNKLAQGVGPAPKIAYTLAAKKQIFPDVFDQRSIPDYDLAGAVLGQMVDQFTAQSIRQIIDKDYVSHKDLGDWAQQLILQQRYRNPESWAYYSIRDKAADYAREKYGSDVEFGANNSKSARAVSGFRKAIYYGDPDAAMHWYLQLLDYGYTKEQFQGSIRGQNPLNAVKVGDRAAFLKSLTPYEREQVQLAMQHYAKIRSFKGRELDLFPRKAGGDREADYYRKKADSRAKTMQSIIRAQDRMSPEALRSTGESLIREEEYRW